MEFPKKNKAFEPQIDFVKIQNLDYSFFDNAERQLSSQSDQRNQLQNYQDQDQPQDDDQYVYAKNEELYGENLSEMKEQFEEDYSEQYNQVQPCRPKFPKKNSIIEEFFRTMRDNEYGVQNLVCVKCYHKIVKRQNKNQNIQDMYIHIEKDHSELLLPIQEANEFFNQIESANRNTVKKEFRDRKYSKVKLQEKKKQKKQNKMISSDKNIHAKKAAKKIHVKHIEDENENQYYEQISEPNSHIEKRHGRPRSCPIWQIFIQQNDTVICQICHIVMKKRRNRELNRHLMRAHPQAKWLLDKQIRQGLYEIRDKYQALVRDKKIQS